MGVPGPLIEIFLQEHAHRPWRGRLLTLGRQTILVDAPRRCRLLERTVSVGAQCEHGRISATAAARGRPDAHFVTDDTLFTAFAPDLHVDVIDVSDYEGANLIWNMCEPVPRRLHGTYDIILNGSVLDNSTAPVSSSCCGASGTAWCSSCTAVVPIHRHLTAWLGPAGKWLSILLTFHISLLRLDSVPCEYNDGVSSARVGPGIVQLGRPLRICVIRARRRCSRCEPGCRMLFGADSAGQAGGRSVHLLPVLTGAADASIRHRRGEAEAHAVELMHSTTRFSPALRSIAVCSRYGFRICGSVKSVTASPRRERC
jgi:hypothetical protein